MLFRSVLQAIWQSNDDPSALAGVWNYILMVTPDLSEHDFAEVAAALPQSQGTIMATLAEQLIKKGRQEGRQEGLERGREEGQRQTLARLLELKFGPVPEWAQARLATAPPGGLARWTERVLTAESLRDVFVAEQP